MGRLRDEMEARMRLSNYRERSIESYVRCVSDLAKHYRRSPEELSAEEVRSFLLHRREVDKVSVSTQRLYVFGLRYLYREVLQRPEVAQALPVPRGPQRLPEVPTREEMRKLLGAARSVRDHALLSLAYATGLRVSELVALQVHHIDAEAGLIHVLDGKGGSDRVAPLSPKLVETLRAYWAAVRPAKPWLFVGKDDSRHLSVSAAQGAVRFAAQQAGLTRRISTHSLRHAFATHMLEDGADVRLVQQVLGHSDLSTTARYLRVCEARLRHAEGPLDRLTR